MAITTTRLRKQAAQQKGMVEIYRKQAERHGRDPDTAPAVLECQKRVEELNRKIAERETKEN